MSYPPDGGELPSDALLLTHADVLAAVIESIPDDIEIFKVPGYVRAELESRHVPPAVVALGVALVRAVTRVR